MGATFRRPARYDDELCVRAAVTDPDDPQFRIAYTLEVSERAASDDFERQTWAISNQ
jgi:acyl-CoA thioesterase FadM